MPDLPPPVSISGGPTRAAPASRQRWSRRTRGTVVAVAGLALLGYVASAVHSAARRRTAAAAVAASHAEASSLRLVVTAGAAVEQQGRPGLDLQDAKVLLSVRNDGPADVRILTTSLDEGPRQNADALLRSRDTARVPALWQVRCAEVGSLDGPRLLDLQVRASAGRHDLRLRLPFTPRRHLPPSDLARVFHRAAVQACDVLVPAKG